MYNFYLTRTYFSEELSFAIVRAEAHPDTGSSSSSEKLNHK